MYTSIPFSSLLLAATLSISSILAYPTTNPENLTPRTSHPCSIYIQRWKSNAFDVGYYSSGLLADGTVNNQFNFANQEVSDATSAAAPAPVDTHAVGSRVLQIINVANPVNDDPNDPGKLSFSWGDQKWTSFEAGSPCVVRPVGNWETPGFHSYACNFSCDI